MKRLRLVKVVVQAYFVIDDGESLTERVADPVVVQPADWPGYSGEPFETQVKELEASLA